MIDMKTTIETAEKFDHNGDKVAFKSSWIDGKDGLLARDIDNDGKITSGAILEFPALYFLGNSGIYFREF